MANELTKIPKFRRCVLQNFPFIEQDFDALTDYQLLCKVVEYLNKVINSQNELIDVAESLTVAFNQLQSFVETYFENLDVQEEINNKLDQMAEDGQLADIIAQYLGLAGVLAFPTVADMKTAENLVNGSSCKTAGYHSVDDGGDGYYHVREVTNEDVIDEGKLIALHNNQLVAELIVTDGVNVKQFGAYGDGTHNDHDAIANAFKLGVPVYFPKSTSYYLTDEGFTPTNSIKMDGFVKLQTPHGIADEVIFLYNNVQSAKTIVVENPLIDGGWTESNTVTEYGHGISIKGSKNIRVNGGIIKNIAGDGVCVSCSEGTRLYDYSENVIIENTKITDIYRNGVSVISAIDCTLNNLYIEKNNSNYGVGGVDIEPNADSTLKTINIKLNNLTIKAKSYPCIKSYLGYNIGNVEINNITAYTGNIAINMGGANDTTNTFDKLNINNITIYDYNSENTVSECLFINHANRCFINNVISYSSNIRSNISWIRLIDNLVIRNCYFENSLTSQPFGILATSVMLDNCTFDYKNATSSYNGAVTVNSPNVIINNCQFLNNQNSLSLDYAGNINLQVTNCTFTPNESYSASRAIVLNGTGTTVVYQNIANNNYTNCGSARYVATGCAFAYITPEMRLLNVSGTSDSIPTYTQSRYGDIVLKVNPTAGGSIGWVYTAAGWKEFGSIAS